MTDQPEAIRWACLLEREAAHHGATDYKHKAAAELRRLHDHTQMLEHAYKSACDIVEEQDKKLVDLDAVNQELLEALRLTSIDCQYLHHAHKDRHLLFEGCPVVARINAAIAKAERSKT